MDLNHIQNLVLCWLVILWTMVVGSRCDEPCYNTGEQEDYNCLAGCCGVNEQVHCCVDNSIIIVIIIAILICVVVSVIAIYNIIKLNKTAKTCIQPESHSDDRNSCGVSVVQNQTIGDIVTTEPIQPPPYTESPPPSYESLGHTLPSTQRVQTDSEHQTSSNNVQLNTHHICTDIPQPHSYPDIHYTLNQRYESTIHRPPPVYTRRHRPTNVFSLFRRDLVDLDPPPQYGVYVHLTRHNTRPNSMSTC